VLEQAAFVKFLQNRRSRFEIRKRMLDSSLPFRVRQIAAKRNAPACPSRGAKIRSLSKEDRDLSG